MYKKLLNLAVIPARSGSKRIKNKNIVKLHNRPLIYWTIKAAQDSKMFDYIFVSTDSVRIKKIVEKFGLEVPFLREINLADDKVRVDLSTIDAIQKLKEIKKITFKNVVQLMPNCPLRTSIDIKKHLINFKKKKIKSQISCMETLGSNSWWSFYFKKKKAVNFFPSSLKKRSQDLPKIYTPSGSIWISDVDHLTSQNSFYNAKTNFYPINWYSGIDIDTIDDLKLVKNLKKSLIK